MNQKLPNFFKSFNYKSGQATLLAILIISAVAIVTAVGVATRQNIGVRRTTYTSQTDQAFGCANSGVDKAMLCIKNAEEAGDDPLTTCGEADVALQDEDSAEICKYTYTVSDLLPDGGSISLAKLPRDAVQQFAAVPNSTLKIEFSKFSDDLPDVGLEVTVAYQESGGNTGVEKVLKYCGEAPNTTSGFDEETPDATTNVCSFDMSLSSMGIPAGAETIVRIRPYYGSVVLDVSGLPDGVSQGYLISSHGVSGTVQRNIEVMRMNPQLPAIFDYVLYSEEGSITK